MGQKFHRFFICSFIFLLSMQTFKTSKSRENILRRIRKALSGKALPMPFPEVDKEPTALAFDMQAPSAEEGFAEQFIKLGGKFIFCDNEQELLENIISLYENRGWQQLLCADTRLLGIFENNKLDIVVSASVMDEKADACITGCECIVSRTGSIMLSSRQFMGRSAPVFFPVHIVVVYADQVIPDIQQGIAMLRKKYGDDLPSMINLNTGPSRTADIEKTLVVGVHGPGEVFCLFVNA
jgi:L-lactate dehydrogenase complex protein LldG